MCFMQCRPANMHHHCESGYRRRVTMSWIWPLLAIACVSGCNGCRRGATPGDGASVVQPHIATQVHAQGAPETQPAALSRTEALALRSPPVDPAEVVQFQVVSNPYAGKFRGTFALEGQGGVAFFVDGQLAYPALTCINPQCPAKGQGDDGDPFLFVREFKDVRQGPDGQIIWPENPEITADPVCPACRQNGTIRPYVLPSTQRRMGELQAELQQARQAYQIAKSQGLPRAAGHRTPSEIMQEMESLKQLYLIKGANN